jgi:hypothetical protein
MPVARGTEARLGIRKIGQISIRGEVEEISAAAKQFHLLGI